MGLADKMAKAQQAAGAYGAAPGGQPQYVSTPSSYPPPQSQSHIPQPYPPAPSPYQQSPYQPPPPMPPRPSQPPYGGYNTGPQGGRYGGQAQPQYGGGQPQYNTQYNAPNTNYQQPPAGGQQYQAYPGQGGQPGQPPYSAPSGQYGAPPPGGAPGYPPQGQPPMRQAQQNPNAYRSLLQQTIQEKNIQNLFQNPQILDQICAQAPAKVQQLINSWKVEPEIAQDIVKLSLFDIIVFCDDSGSMAFEENGERIDDLKMILSRAAFAASLFDQDGIEIRFMNSDLQGNHIHNSMEVEQMIQRVQFKGLTPLGTALKNKVIDPLIIQKARSNQLRKPVLVICITDGQPAGEPANAVFDAIRYASTELARTPYGKGAVSFQFAQVGNDLKAREFLARLDNEPGIGELVDCTSNFESEQDEMAKASPPMDLTPDMWLVKLLLGAVDSSYDTKDEKGSRPQGGQPGYGAPQGQYGQRPQYGEPQQGQYGTPTPQQYGQPQYGQQQGQYGQQPQYGAPQGQYGAPPPHGQPSYPGQGGQPPYPQGGPGGQYPGKPKY